MQNLSNDRKNSGFRKIIVINVKIELKSKKENSELRTGHPEDFQSFVDS